MMIGIGTPSSQSKIPRPTGTSSFVSCKDLTRRTPLGQNSCIAPEAGVGEAGNCIPAFRSMGPSSKLDAGARTLSFAIMVMEFGETLLVGSVSSPWRIRPPRNEKKRRHLTAAVAATSPHRRTSPPRERTSLIAIDAAATRAPEQWSLQIIIYWSGCPLRLCLKASGSPFGLANRENRIHCRE